MLERSQTLLKLEFQNEKFQKFDEIATKVSWFFNIHENLDLSRKLSIELKGVGRAEDNTDSEVKAAMTGVIDVILDLTNLQTSMTMSSYLCIWFRIQN